MHKQQLTVVKLGNWLQQEGWIRPSKLRLPDNTDVTNGSSSAIAFSISGNKGPELPIQVVHP